MKLHLLASAFVLVLAPLASRAADEENPYKNAKVGDFAKYKLTVSVAGQNVEGDLTQTVTAKSDKEVTLKVTGKVNGMDVPAQDQKIDLTKPFDPTKLGQQPGGSDMKVEKGKEGTEKIKLNDKEYETKWTNYKVTGKANGLEIDSDMKVWLSKDLPGVLAKMESTMSVAGMKMVMKMELTETGNKK
jgi:hypothetical protein